MKDSGILHNPKWSKWKKFPDPNKLEYLIAPFGFGVYQLKLKPNSDEKPYLLFGRGKHLVSRMSSLLPKPDGTGTRNNASKRKFVKEHLGQVYYRTIAFKTEVEMINFERKLRQLKVHRFNT